MRFGNVGSIPSTRTLFVALVVAAVAALFSSSAASQRRPRYALVDLGALAGAASSAAAIDEHGTVVGSSSTDLGERRAQIWLGDGSAQELGTLQNGTYSFATAVSDDGAWIVGNSGIRPLVDPHHFDDIEQGFVWHQDAMQSVGALYNPATVNRRFGTSEAYGVNDHGQVVGYSVVFRQGLQSAFLWEDGVMTDIGLANETAFNSRAFDINNAGQVVGDIVTGSADLVGSQAFLWQEGAFSYLPHPDGYTSSTALAINEAGQVVGWSGDGPNTTAVLWSSEGVTAIGGLPGDESSQALDINDLGQVVGRSGASGQTRAVIWRSGVAVDLNSVLPAGTEWILTEASEVDNRGAIVGSGLNRGEVRAFLLRPRPACR